MDFWVIFGSKKLKNYFYFDFAYGNGTGHSSSADNSTKKEGLNKFWTRVLSLSNDGEWEKKKFRQGFSLDSMYCSSINGIVRVFKNK